MTVVKSGQVWERGEELTALVLRVRPDRVSVNHVDVLWLRHIWPGNEGKVTAVYIGEQDPSWRRIA